MEITLPHMDEFAHAPGPLFNGRANKADITLREYDPLFGPVDLTYEDQVFEPEGAENLDYDALLNQEIDRMSRAVSEEPGLDIRARMERELADMDEELLMEEARRNSASSNAAESRLHELARSEWKEVTGVDGISRLRGSMPEFEPLANFSVPEPMEFESFAVPDEVVGGVVPGKKQNLIFQIIYIQTKMSPNPTFLWIRCPARRFAKRWLRSERHSSVVERHAVVVHNIWLQTRIPAWMTTKCAPRWTASSRIRGVSFKLVF